MNMQLQADTHLRGYALVLARAAWIGLAALMIGISVMFVPVRWAQLVQLFAQDAVALAQLGWSAELCAAFRTGVGLLLLSGSLTLALLIFWQRSNDWFALFVSLMVLSVGALFHNLSALTAVPPEWYAPASLVRVGATSMFFLTLYLFPGGHWVTRHARVLGAISIVYALSWIAFPDSPLNALRLDKWPLALMMVALWMGIGVLTQIYRYRRASHPIERQQTKWVVYGWVSSTVVFVFVYLPASLWPVFSEAGALRLLYNLFAEPTFQCAVFLSIVSMVISILRYRLFDIDIIIRRTLIYSVLTIMLACVYIGSIISLQQIFRVLTGTQQSEIITVISTLAIAALFVPLRNRIQNVIDRRFYRRKYDAQKVLAEFAATARDEVDLQRLSEGLLDVVDETMQPAHVSLWLRPTEREVKR